MTPPRKTHPPQSKRLFTEPEHPAEIYTANVDGAARGNPGVAARPLALPGALDDALGEAACDVLRAVFAAVEHDDDLVGEAEPRQALGELRFLVMGDNERREQWRERGIGGARRALAGRDRHDPAPAAAASGSPAMRCNSSRAAVSAMATDRLSISVSVVR